VRKRSIAPLPLTTLATRQNRALKHATMSYRPLTSFKPLAGPPAAVSGQSTSLNNTAKGKGKARATEQDELEWERDAQGQIQQQKQQGYKCESSRRRSKSGAPLPLDSLTQVCLPLCSRQRISTASAYSPSTGERDHEYETETNLSSFFTTAAQATEEGLGHRRRTS
jgi:hypothetical protein